ncbi:MAG: hypothetical protein Q7S56_01720 [Nanoarchaeota archaeon]|nr:hypothetical protein [Nanoarchaeota archaeon]
MVELEELYRGMSEGLRDHFCDSRLFPSMDFLRESSDRVARFKHHKTRLEKRFDSGSEEYKIGLEYLTRLYGVEKRVR